MLKTGILNPHINELLSRFRHTNTIVVSDRGFPFWPEVPTVDISLVDGVPTVMQVLEALAPAVTIGKAWMAEEFAAVNEAGVIEGFANVLGDVKIEREPHDEFKRRVPRAIGLIRTADTTQYANIILESA
ncbi:D-ribose pyranase [Pseudobythopirellula maris]|uniref:D-ribose pyranase n=1 Tax=Pseudobythopirellula maris TaxID=2527991 RepID=A0A5C5ZVU1_9BACT|nr:RbsD/FucU family protein [Pseudobythopirellula maris]TWT91081.1 D-ribose pyranase [Pseudobythopirellula maris]